MFKSKNQITFILFSLSLLFMLSYLTMYSNLYIVDFSMLSSNSSEFIFSLILDKVSILFGIVVTLISGSVFMFSRKYMSEETYFFRFSLILLSFVISMCMLIFSGSFIFMLLGWDGLGVTSFALIIFYQSKDSLVAGFQTFLINRLGDVFIIISFVAFLFSGQFCFSYSMSTNYTILLLLCLAALTKSAQYPFSSWLPAAMAAPTPVSALVHSSTLVTAGIFLIIRMTIQNPITFDLSEMLLFLGAITCLLGGTAALFEFDLKKIIALSTLSQLGLMVFTLGMGLPDLSLFHLFTHALFKALLFITAGGILISSFGSQDLRYLGNICNTMPFSTAIFNISGFCLMGLPFLSAFYSKHMILDKMMMTNINMVSFMIMSFASMMTIIYTIRMMKSLIWEKPSLTMMNKDNSYLIHLPMMILGFFSILGGKYLLNMENWFLNYSLSPNSNILNLMLILGVLIGLLVKFNFNSYMWSTLFYLTPMYNFSGKLIYPLINNLKYLDYGWLEVSPQMNYILLKLSAKVDSLMSWPKQISGFYRVFLLGLMIFIYVNTNF
uniref:NADH dehydrogenase subunit 5 n=1 Tax=Polypylis sp. TS-2018 TaxID=2483258 RepID=UPI002A814872|nr:NADH dehydrogenase subunit 5 [Polypylis sp. TS-2018]WOZ13953.1 NADH dehydrogenase subunit 5 [Polypylis sp. TS-2018]